MTIALGMLTPRGVIIAADSQEGTGFAGDMKLSAHKIMTGLHVNTNVPSDRGSIAVSGAGFVGHLEFIKQEIIAAFNQNKDLPITSFDSELKRIIKDFYTEHVIPFSQYPPAERPEIELIIGAQRRRERRLWVTDMTTVRTCQYAAVGSGRIYALDILRRLFEWIDNDLAQVVAAYAVFVAKEKAEGCGKETEIVTIIDDFFDRKPDDNQIKAWENWFKSYEQLETQALRYTLGFPFRNEPYNAEEVIDNVRAMLKSMRELFMPSNSETSKPEK